MNPESHSSSAKKYYLKNKEKINKYTAQYLRDHRERFNANRRRRKLLKKQQLLKEELELAVQEDQLVAAKKLLSKLVYQKINNWYK